MSLGEEGKEKGGEGKGKMWRSLSHIPGKVRDLYMCVGSVKLCVLGATIQLSLLEFIRHRPMK